MSPNQVLILTCRRGSIPSGADRMGMRSRCSSPIRPILWPCAAGVSDADGLTNSGYSSRRPRRRGARPNDRPGQLPISTTSINPPFKQGGVYQWKV